MKFMEKAKRFFTLNAANHEGFTLVELIVVIAILAILAGVAVPAYSGYVKKAEKAGDLQLLGAVNDAFAAACFENNVHPANLANGSVNLILNSDGTVDSVSEYNNEFAVYFAGNFNTPFKVFKNGDLIFVDGAFKEPTNGAAGKLFSSVIGNDKYTDDINAIKGSALPGIGGDALVEQVEEVTGIAAALIAATKTNAEGDVEASALSKVVMSDGYLETMAQKLGYKDGSEYYDALMEMYNEDPEAAADFMANTTLLNVAGTVGGWTEEEETAMKNSLIGLDYTALVKKVTTDATAEEGLAEAALLYGMYTTFDPEGAKTLISDTDPLASMQNIGSKTNASGQTFAEYLAELNTVGSQAYKDFEGYKGALNVVDGAASESPDAAKELMTNGYNNTELAAMLNQIMRN